jgi:hypothetical protein
VVLLRGAKQAASQRSLSSFKGITSGRSKSRKRHLSLDGLIRPVFIVRESVHDALELRGHDYLMYLAIVDVVPRSMRGTQVDATPGANCFSR